MSSFYGIAAGIRYRQEGLEEKADSTPKKIQVGENSYFLKGERESISFISPFKGTPPPKLVLRALSPRQKERDRGEQQFSSDFCEADGAISVSRGDLLSEKGCQLKWVNWEKPKNVGRAVNQFFNVKMKEELSLAVEKVHSDHGFNPSSKADRKILKKIVGLFASQTKNGLVRPEFKQRKWKAVGEGGKVFCVVSRVLEVKKIVTYVLPHFANGADKKVYKCLTLSLGESAELTASVKEAYQVSSGASIDEMIRELNLQRSCQESPYIMEAAELLPACSGAPVHIRSELLQKLAEGSLEDYVSEKKSLPSTAKILRNYQELALALQFLHEEKKVVHRDVKPANVFLDEGIAKLADFGKAIKGERRVEGPEKNQGTPVYSSFEALLDGEHGFPMDIWAFGVSLFEIFSPKRVIEEGKEESAKLPGFLDVEGVPDPLPQEYRDLGLNEVDAYSFRLTCTKKRQAVEQVEEAEVALGEESEFSRLDIEKISPYQTKLFYGWQKIANSDLVTTSVMKLIVSCFQIDVEKRVKARDVETSLSVILDLIDKS